TVALFSFSLDGRMGTHAIDIELPDLHAAGYGVGYAGLTARRRHNFFGPSVEIETARSTIQQKERDEVKRGWMGARSPFRLTLHGRERVEGLPRGKVSFSKGERHETDRDCRVGRGAGGRCCTVRAGGSAEDAHAGKGARVAQAARGRV